MSVRCCSGRTSTNCLSRLRNQTTLPCPALQVFLLCHPVDARPGTPIRCRGGQVRGWSCSYSLPVFDWRQKDNNSCAFWCGMQIWCGELVIAGLTYFHALVGWRHWLEGAGQPSIAWTDHKYSRGGKSLNSREARWARYFVTLFNFSVSCCPGSCNGKSDILSWQFEVEDWAWTEPPSCLRTAWSDQSPLMSRRKYNVHSWKLRRLPAYFILSSWHSLQENTPEFMSACPARNKITCQTPFRLLRHLLVPQCPWCPSPPNRWG